MYLINATDQGKEIVREVVLHLNGIFEINLDIYLICLKVKGPVPME